MKAAVLASTPQLAAALRRVLDGLHKEKKMAGVDSMLCRCVYNIHVCLCVCSCTCIFVQLTVPLCLRASAFCVTY